MKRKLVLALAVMSALGVASSGAFAQSDESKEEKKPEQSLIILEQGQASRPLTVADEDKKDSPYPQLIAEDEKKETEKPQVVADEDKKETSPFPQLIADEDKKDVEKPQLVADSHEKETEKPQLTA